MMTGSLCFTLILMSPKPCSSNSDASHSALSTSASGVALPYFSIIRLSSEPALTPMRIGMPAAPAGHPDDVAAGRGELGDLLQRRIHVMRLGGRHRLHRDGIVAADADVTDH